MMAGMANFWGRVKSGNLSLNHWRTGGHKRSSNCSDSKGNPSKQSRPFLFATLWGWSVQKVFKSIPIP